MYTLKKSLGQHFLQDENICKKIVQHLQEQRFSNLLEVGPGGGALTKHLLELEGIRFLAAEVDEEKVNYLKGKWPQLQDKVILTDFLQMERPFEEPFFVVGN